MTNSMISFWLNMMISASNRVENAARMAVKPHLRSGCLKLEMQMGSDTIARYRLAQHMAH
jgi:hypothetical protein